MRKDHTSGIGGWLILPMLGLIISPIRLGYILLTVHLQIFTSGAWPVLTTPGSDAYHPLWAPILFFEIFANTALMCLSVALLILLFAKSHHFPRWMIAFYIASFCILAIDQSLGQQIPFVAAQEDPTSTRELIRSIIAMAIWIPYFIKSERVRNTFLEPSNQPLAQTLTIPDD